MESAQRSLKRSDDIQEQRELVALLRGLCE